MGSKLIEQFAQHNNVGSKVTVLTKRPEELTADMLNHEKVTY